MERADGSRATRDIAGHPGAVAIIALDAEDRVALVRQWRLPADAALLEIPAGGLDVTDGAKEDPEPAARRELEEETGLRAGTWQKLGSFYSAPGFTDELMHLYLATDLEPASADGRLGPDDDERLILEWRPWSAAVQAVERGEIRDAKSIVGLFWLERLRGGPHARAAGASAAPLRPAADATAPAAESVTVTYRLTLGEMVRAVVGLAGRSTSLRLVGFLVVAITLVPALNGELAPVPFLILGAGIATGWFTAPFAWWQYRKRPDLIGADITLNADAGGVETDTPFSHGRTTWSTYRRVHDVAGCLLFDNDAGVSMVVPKRAFSPAELDVLYGLLERNRLLPAGSTR